MNTVTKVAIQKNILKTFQEDLQTYTKKLDTIHNRIELKSYIAHEFKAFIECFIVFGDEISTTSSNANDIYMVNYVLSEGFKIVALLHRDVFLELNKVSISNQENQLTENQIYNHYTSSKTILEKKLVDFNNLIVLDKNATNNTNAVYKKNAQKISLQKNPWDIYKSQYKTIINQLKEIDIQKVLAFETIVTFNNLKQVVIDITTNHNLLVNEMEKIENHIFNNTKDSLDHDRLYTYVDEQLAVKTTIENKHFTFSETVNNQINQLQKLAIPISAKGGLLSVREIELKKITQKWFDYQILPEFMDLVNIETSLISKFNLSLLNLKNSLQYSKEKQEDVKIDTILSTLSHLKEDVKKIKESGKIISQSLINKVNTKLLVTHLIQGKDFLDVTLNSSLHIERNSIIKKIKDVFKERTLYFNSQYKKSLQYEALSNMELSTQCISHRMFQNKNTHYDSLFLNKQFIGDLFLIPRKSQEHKMKQIVAHWNEGFHKSVLITGDRLSGRSTFLDYCAKKFFGKDIVVLQPNSDATIDGRKFNTTNDLKEALLYIKNNNGKSTRPIILIDDLELWRDDKFSFLYNIKALVNFIETTSDETFVMASTTNIMLDHLNNRMNFSDAFSRVININEADEDEIINAILLRHGAAHRDLFSEDLEVISENKIRRLSLKLCKNNAYNFGNTLQSWTFHTSVQDDEKVVFKESFYEFLDFFTAQEIIILKQVLVFKFISEFSIKNVTTTSFDAEFKSALRRLVNVKVLLRDLNGSLYLNPVVVNDVARIVNNKINT
ncbi:hypothetical protein [Polaribacter sp.]|uniref:hypothetical protein n=1 Tax=Polaribacter sp. TaxID=1920175 RepID=UPI003EF98F31